MVYGRKETEQIVGKNKKKKVNKVGFYEEDTSKDNQKRVIDLGENLVTDHGGDNLITQNALTESDQLFDEEDDT